jgi:FAD/FMN-containing dehydrogenase
MSPFLSFDVSLELTSIEHYLETIYRELRRRYIGVRTITFGHLGDNNIHIGITIGPDTSDAESQIEEIVYGALRGFRGSISAEHGIGQHKRAFLARHKSAEEMEVMRRI